MSRVDIITDETAKEVIGYINNIDIFEDVKSISKEKALESGLLNYIGEDIDIFPIYHLNNKAGKT